MLLDETLAAVSAQLNDQEKLGVRFESHISIPGNISTRNGIWYRIPDVVCAFVDIDKSTQMNIYNSRETTALIYTYFVTAMSAIFEKFSAKYVDIQGDGLFGLFDGKQSVFSAVACAITMKTVIENDIQERLEENEISDWKLAAGVGIDSGIVWVRRLGSRLLKRNEVWAGKPVNIASKLSSRASHSQILVSDRIYNSFEQADENRKFALLNHCGCSGNSKNKPVWRSEQPSRKRGFDFKTIYRSNIGWCPTHGDEFCEAIVNGKRIRG